MDCYLGKILREMDILGYLGMIFTEIRLALGTFSLFTIYKQTVTQKAWETGKERRNSKALIWPVAVLPGYAHVILS